MLRTKKEQLDSSHIGETAKLSDFERQIKIRNQHWTLEAEVLKNDTIHSIALRNNCSVSDIKKLNKIIQDNEIHAFKTLKVPLSPQNVLADVLPKVHKSGDNSPKNFSGSISLNNVTTSSTFEEKLLVASVVSCVLKSSESDDDKVDDHIETESPLNEPLLAEKQFRGYPKAIRARKNDFLSFNGSDCELSWVFLLIGILAFCVIIPLIYVLYVYEHPESFNSHSKYYDPDEHFRAHIDDGKNVTTHH